MVFLESLLDWLVDSGEPTWRVLSHVTHPGDDFRARECSDLGKTEYVLTHTNLLLPSLALEDTTQ